jgi:hypothetical protein
MSLVEELFNQVENSQRFAYIANELESSNANSFSYDEILAVISYIEKVSPEELYLLRGVVTEDEKRYINAELSNKEGNTTYNILIRENSRFEKPISVLSKITEIELEQTNADLLFGSLGSILNPQLNKNQIIHKNLFIESEYLAICIDGCWFTYRNRENRKKLLVNNLNIKEDLVPIF